APAPHERPAPQTGPAPGARPAPGTPAAPAAPGVPSAPPAQPIAAAGEERLVLQDGRTRAVFTNRGAQLLSMVVPENANPRSGTLELVRKRTGGMYPYALTAGRGLQPHPLDQALFHAERSADGRSVVFRYSGPQGAAEKRFRFNERGLLEAEVILPGRGDWGVLLGPGIRNPTPEEMKSRYERRRAVYKAGDEVRLLDAQGATEAVEVAGRSLRWVGLADTYFLSAQIPQAGLERALIEPVLVEPGEREAVRFVPVPPEEEITKEQKDLPREFLVVLRPAGDRLALTSYWGPKEYDRLQALPYGLEGTIELGWFGFLARPLLAALHWIYDHIVANYGWAIVLLTVLIKIALLPLTHSSTKSMRKMQELNPKVQAIRDRYRTKLRDKQGRPNLEMQRKMNEEVMAIYKEAGVNPAGGCLPLLLQMPILFAFYNLLSTAVDLRKAPWILWIRDLSVHDPFYVLPIIMGATQVLQVRMGPQAGDPMQRRMFQIMPIAMTFLFLGVPSGLVLYWLTNNVLTILQLQVYNRLREREA
ncbi:MAG TPA: membrane protein insertase YidC, partial [Thermoanaerobaculia bacterium]